jgi:hypothetical protein
MNKKEISKSLRKKLTEAIRSLPDVEYKRASMSEDTIKQGERDHTGNTLHIIELMVEEKRT